MADGNDMHANSFRTTGIDTRSVAFFFGVSLCCHVAAVVMIVLSPGFHLFKRKPLPPVMQVSLVQLPGGNPAPGPAAASPTPSAPAPPTKQPPKEKEVVKVPEPKPAPVVEPQPQPKKEAVPVPPKVEPKKEFKEKTSLKKETQKKAIPIVKPEKTPPPAPEPPKPKPEPKAEPEEKTPPAKAEPQKPTESSEAMISKALENMKQRVAKSGPPSSGVQGTSSSGSGAGGVLGGTDRGGSVIGTPMQLYEQDVGNRVTLNWAYSSLEGTGSQRLEAVVMIRIAANGEILETWYEKKSGNNRLDDSAFNAIRKSNPLPKLPPGEKEHIMGIRFTPQGVN